MPHIADQFEPGQRVAVTQQIPMRGRVWVTRVAGAVVRCEQKKTGSWFAGAKDDRLWLDRLIVKKDDGEIVVFNLDGYTHVEVLDVPKQSPAPEMPPQGHPGPSPDAPVAAAPDKAVAGP